MDTNNKNFLSIDDQINRLTKKHKLSPITDEDHVYEFLLKHNYFDVINGLEELFPAGSTKPKNFKGYCFEDFEQLYELNIELRSIGLKIIAEFETNVKSLTAYYFNEFVQRQDPQSNHTLSYLDEHYFFPNFQGDTNTENAEEILNIKNKFKLFQTVNHPNIPDRYNGLNSSEITALYRNRYMSEKMKNRSLLQNFDIPPLWVTIKVFDFGDLIKFLAVSPSTVVNSVKSKLNFSEYNREQFLAVLLSIKNFRNHMAHVQMLNKFTNKPQYEFESNIKITKHSFVGGDNISVYNLFQLLSKSVKINEFIDLIRKISHNNNILSENLLQSMGNVDLNSWEKIIDN